jgi:hypothetical protein
LVYTTEEKRVEEKKVDFLCSLSWISHYNFARDGFIEPTVLLCPSKIVRHGNKKKCSLVVVFSAIKNSVFKDFYLFLNKYVAEIQLPGNGIQQLSILQSSKYLSR